MSIINNICEHGHLERKCEVCELKAEIARLRSVCRDARKTALELRKRAFHDPLLWCPLMEICDALEAAGKEPSDG